MAKAKAKVKKQIGPIRIDIPPPDTRRLRLHVRGLTPYYSNGGIEHAARQMEKEYALSPEALKQRKKDRKENRLPPREPDAEFAQSLRPIDGKNGRYGIPAAAFKKALVAAGSRAGRYGALLQEAVWINGPLVEIKKSKPKYDVRVGRTGNWKSRVPHEIYQARFDTWEVDLEIGFDATLIDANSILNAMAAAGARLGVGAFRPTCSGDFGRFSVTVLVPRRTVR